MKKTVWISFFISLVLINLFAWLMQQYSGFTIPLVLRLVMVLGITFGTIVLAGAFALVSKFEEEKPLTGHVKDSLQQEAANQPGQNEQNEQNASDNPRSD
jgi:predicted PurR-regulated permease PerM